MKHKIHNKNIVKTITNKTSKLKKKKLKLNN